MADQHTQALHTKLHCVGLNVQSLCIHCVSAPSSLHCRPHTIQQERLPLCVPSASSSDSPPQQGSSSAAAAPAEELVPDSEFSITKISYGSILTPLGVFLLAYGFGAFFQVLPGAGVSPLMLIYGFPISLLGFALAYAQVCTRPVWPAGMFLSSLHVQLQAHAHRLRITL